MCMPNYCAPYPAVVVSKLRGVTTSDITQLGIKHTHAMFAFMFCPLQKQYSFRKGCLPNIELFTSRSS